MNKIKLSLSMIAAIIGLSAAFAFKPAPQTKAADVLWGRDEEGNWHNIESTPNMPCTLDDDPCKARFPEGVTPTQNQQPAPGATVEAEGYITL